MSTQTGITLKTYFNTGDKPTEAQFADLIDSKLNLTDGGNVTGNITSSKNLSLSYTSGSTPGTTISIYSGSSATFDAIAPPFVENLQPHIKVYNLEFANVLNHFHYSGSDAVGENFGGALSGSNISDRNSLWEMDEDNAAKLIASASNAGGLDFPYGSLQLQTGASSGHQTALMAANNSFKCTPGKPWWVTTKFALDQHDTSEFFFGVAEEDFDTDSLHLTALGADASRVGFLKKAANVDAVTFAANSGSSGTIESAFDPAFVYSADGMNMGLGIYWDGASKVQFFASSSANGELLGQLPKIGEATANLPDTRNMYLGFLLEAGEAAVQKVQIEYIRGAFTI